MEYKENYEMLKCRDYKEEVEILEKRLYAFETENNALKLEIDALRETIVNMAKARYLRGEA
jgi:regulator of replication initiation timing